MLIMQIGWPIATRPAIEHGSGQKSSFSTCWTLAIVNSYILLSSCGGKKILHRDFWLTLIREMLARSEHEPRPSMPVWRPASASNNTGRLDKRHKKHWPGHSNMKRRCCVRSVGGVKRTVIFRCVKCDVVFVLTETVLKITTQRPNCKTSIHPSSIQTAEASTTT